MTSEAYVFIEGLESEPVLCGRVSLNTRTEVGTFVYGKSYLARANAFAIDPIHLPLTETEHLCTINKGIFGVLSDAGADSWGRKLITQLHRTQPQNELEFLIAGAAMGVGALSFSLSRERTKPKLSPNTLADLELLRRGKNAILAAEEVSDEVRQAFVFGSSMGGARPKTLLTHQDQEYLVKFNKADDRYNVARVEHATMRMLDELDAVHVASSEVISTGEDDSATEDVFLVKRFDRSAGAVSHHFLSANTLLQQSSISQLSLKTWYSYGRLAELLRQHSAEASDAIDLYYRMVFNVLIGNTDDHARNHAWLMPLDFHEQHISPQQAWRLAPAYDVLPINASRQHSLGIGDYGREGTKENMLSQAKRFGLQDFKARKIIDEVSQLVAEWPHYFRQNQVSAGDIERIRNMIPPLS